jgi:large subunit ribosomal protein L29
MTSNEMRQMSREEVQQLLFDKKEELVNLRLQQTMRQLDNPLLLRQARRDIARLHTVLRELALGIHPLAGAEIQEENA